MIDRPGLRAVPSEPRQIGWYVSVGWNDHLALAEFIAEGGSLTGVVVSAAASDRHAALRNEAREHGKEVILDPHTLEQGFKGGALRPSVQRLPWATRGEVRARDLKGRRSGELIRAIADQVKRLGCDAVIAPTHYLARGIHDPWWPVDVVSALRLRKELDRRGLTAVRIYYRLVLSGALLREDPGQAFRIAARLQRMDIDAVWLRVQPSGPAHVGPVVIRTLLRLCRAIHAAGVPVVAEHFGVVGLALVACGGVGAIEGGVGLGEAFDVGGLKSVPDEADDGFGPPQRVYLAELLSYLSRKDAPVFFANRLLRSRYACTSPCCVSGGVAQTLRQTRRHALHRKGEEVAQLSSIRIIGERSNFSSSCIERLVV